MSVICYFRTLKKNVIRSVTRLKKRWLFENITAKNCRTLEVLVMVRHQGLQNAFNNEITDINIVFYIENVSKLARTFSTSYHQ